MIKDSPIPRLINGRLNVSINLADDDNKMIICVDYNQRIMMAWSKPNWPTPLWTYPVWIVQSF